MGSSGGWTALKQDVPSESFPGVCVSGSTEASAPLKTPSLPGCVLGAPAADCRLGNCRATPLPPSHAHRPRFLPPTPHHALPRRASLPSHAFSEPRPPPFRVRGPLRAPSLTPVLLLHRSPPAPPFFLFPPHSLPLAASPWGSSVLLPTAWSADLALPCQPGPAPPCSSPPPSIQPRAGSIPPWPQCQGLPMKMQCIYKCLLLALKKKNPASCFTSKNGFI